ncbi:DMT family transporter, partial [Candidatus Micrarchaeota archaeon]|nr:DMT family transporter [Candidatus Micrarchaeota archaeon]
AFITALISGFSVFMNGIAVKLADPSVYTLAKGIGALLFLVAAAFALKESRHFSGLSRKQWAMLGLIGIVGGSLPFLMFFWGLSMGGAAISSFIYRSLFIFAAVFGYLVLKETPSPRDFAAGFAILIGNALLVSGDMMFGPAQLLVLGATVLWALEYALSRKVMADVHPKVVMVARMGFGSIFLLAFLGFSSSLSALWSIDIAVLGWLAVTSLLLFAFVTCWYSALKHLPLLKATAILALGGVITAVLEAVVLAKTISMIAVFGLLFVFAGAVIAAGLPDRIRAMLGKPHPGLVE